MKTFERNVLSNIRFHGHDLVLLISTPTVVKHQNSFCNRVIVLQ